MKNLPIIIPISQTNIDWNNFVTVVKNQTGRSPIREIDKANRPVGDYSSYIAALGAFAENLDFSASIRSRPYLLSFLHFSFMISLTEKEYIEILRECNLTCIDNIDARDDSLLVILAGTALEWRRACEIFCSTEYPFRVRYIFDAVLLYLEQIKVFNGIIKKYLSDETFIIP